MRALVALAVAAALGACGERGEAQDERKVLALTQELAPQVERAVGLPFKQPPRVAVRSRDEVRRYLAGKLDHDLPADVTEGMTAAYRLFGLLPDTLDLRALLLALYTEQVAGYYDPDSATFYAVRDADPSVLRMVLAHELVHALQGQYVPLDSLLGGGRDNDRRMAAQAVLEGQATLASLEALMPGRGYDAIPNFWDTYRQQLKQQHQQMPVFGAAPPIIQETLVFPYLEGANFVRWFGKLHADTVPFGARMPESTEQILHPERYAAGDRPVSLALADPRAAMYSDGLGEFEMRVLFEGLTRSEITARAAVLDWDGDRYAVYAAGDGRQALVWWTVWDTERAAARFATLLAREWSKQIRGERRFTVERLAIGGRAGVRLVDGPATWRGWGRLPAVSVR